MKYSVFNKSIGSYSVYEGFPTDFNSYDWNTGEASGSSLGSVPSERVLPNGSQYIGESMNPVGMIVQQDYSFKGFFYKMTITVTGIIIAKLIIDSFGDKK